MRNVKTLDRIIAGWLNGYVEVGSALTELKEIKKREFKSYVQSRFSMTYNRCMQLIYASQTAKKCSVQPKNEAVAMRLYKLTKSDAIGEVKALEFWEKTAASNPSITVPEFNKAIAEEWKVAKPQPKDPTAIDYLGHAISNLESALNLVANNSETIDLTTVDELVAKLHQTQMKIAA